MSLLSAKKCTDCKQFLPINRFSKNPHHTGGYDCACKSCRSIRGKEHREKFKLLGKHYWEDYLLANREKFEPRFWSRTDKHEEGCWQWIGSLNSSGYGSFGIKGTVVASHRVCYVLTYGKISDSKLYVCHHCDCRNCVRPDHLFLGTHKDNMKDCARKGRSGPKNKAPQGEAHGMAKLTSSDVLAIRALYAQGKPTKEIATAYSVNRRTITSIILRQTWKHID